MAVVLERPEPEPDFPQHVWLDKGYDNESLRLAQRSGLISAMNQFRARFSVLL